MLLTSLEDASLCKISSTKAQRLIQCFILARRRAAAKKKLKNLGKSKSTDTEEEEQDEDCGDDGQYNNEPLIYLLCVFFFVCT